jgi:hypothetical protein
MQSQSVTSFKQSLASYTGERSGGTLGHEEDFSLL